MCTISIIPLEGGGLRLVSNRDVGRSRVFAEGPTWRDLRGGSRGIWPTDPEGGGTWVAGATHGVAMTLLNGNPMEPLDLSGHDLTSRGTIIPSVLSEADAGAAIAALERLDLDRYAPFRLVAASLGDGGAPLVSQAFWDREDLLVEHDLAAPLCFASSGLGDDHVLCRLPLFDEMVGGDPSPSVQDLFHEHFWDERPELSVWMSRMDARSVSRTVIEVTEGIGGSTGGGFDVDIQYAPLVDNPAWFGRFVGAK